MGYLKLTRMQELLWEIDTIEKCEVKSIDYLTASQIDSAKERELVLERINFGYHKNFIIFGIRNLSLIDQIYTRMTPFSTMTVIEITDEDTDCLYLEGEESQLSFLTDPKVALIIGCTDKLGIQLDAAFDNFLRVYNLRNTEMISMPYVKSMYAKDLDDILDMIFEKLHTSINSFGNDVEDILIGMDNYINNWGHVFNGLDCKYFKDKFKGKPAIIVGAGPSLDKNIDYLEQAKGKALIFTVDAAMNKLIGKDIVPDVVSSIERIELSTKFYEKGEIPDDVIYVGPNVILGSILDKFKRIIFTGRTGDALFSKFNENLGFSNLSVGLNVSHVLISFARFLGCYPVIFAGLDLAYTGGKTHTEGFSNFFDKEVMDLYRQNIVFVKGINGELLETSENFMYTKSWIESLIARDREGLFINSTEGGANINGAFNLKLTDAVSSYCTDEGLSSLKEIYDDAKNKNVLDKKILTDKAIEFFTKLDDYFNDLIKEAQAYYDKLLGSKKTGRVLLMEDQRKTMDEYLSKNLAGRFILQSITISYHRDIHSFPMLLEKNDEKRMYERSLRYYKTLKAVSEKVLESIDAYKRSLKLFQS